MANKLWLLLTNIWLFVSSDAMPNELNYNKMLLENNPCSTESFTIYDHIQISLDLHLETYSTSEFMHFFDIKHRDEQSKQGLLIVFKRDSSTFYVEMSNAPIRYQSQILYPSNSSHLNTHHEFYITNKQFIWTINGSLAVNSTNVNNHAFIQDAIICFPYDAYYNPLFVQNGTITNFYLKSWGNLSIYESCLDVWQSAQNQTDLIGTTDEYVISFENIRTEAECAFIQISDDEIFVGILFEYFKFEDKHNISCGWNVDIQNGTHCIHMMRIYYIGQEVIHLTLTNHIDGVIIGWLITNKSMLIHTY
eukprot:228083_1